ncbi:zinc-binding dehydrogenase [Paenibacillus hamazuiensis]|uniref:zinc-binding dehydrogenase n=1 Tax=Paenibacillus hamazuiensis TaxID=2936508 RepID=UPI00200F8E56|nr:zinc-binding dehydrogenase [Paenibacillus hamazuiensis]
MRKEKQHLNPVIRAVVADPETPGIFVIDEVEAPVAADSEAVVKVKTFSLNGGEVRNAFLSGKKLRPGWDFAGVVEKAAADGSGPPPGARVVGLVPSGAWSERVAAPTAFLTELPDSVSFAEAACLPVAGLTALYGIEKGGALQGKSVLVTGASGGVGRFACQLAVRAGASVTARIRKPDTIESLRSEGVKNVVVGDDPEPASSYGPFDLILESVGGSSLSSSLSLLATGGTCVLCGNASNQPTVFEAREFYTKGNTHLYGLFLYDELRHHPVSSDLRRLAELVAEGSLRPPIHLEAAWSNISDIARRLMERSIWGKAVMHLEYESPQQERDDDGSPEESG